MSLKCFFGHQWSGCKCERCGKEQHDWNACRCNRCNKTRNKHHKWSDGKCTVCGANQKAEMVKSALKKWYKKSAGQKIGGGICDSCNKQLIRGNSYLKPGGYLYCEKCTDNSLNAEYIKWDEVLKNLNGYFGSDIPQYIVEMGKN